MFDYNVDFISSCHEGLVSIIVPVHNREKYILETLRSISSQIWEIIEVLVVDDHSTDNSAMLIKNYSENVDERVKYLSSDGYGACRARNYGLRRAAGEFIQFFDDDDIMCPNYISARLELIQKRNLDYAGCDFIHFIGDESNIVVHRGISLIPHNIVSHIYYMDLPTQCFLIRRNAISRIGKWNESIKKLQDMAYFHRLFLFNLKGDWLTDELFKYRIHENSISVKNKADSKIYAYQEIGKEWMNMGKYIEIKSVIEMGICTFLHDLWHEDKVSSLSYSIRYFWIIIKRIIYKVILRYPDRKVLEGKI